MKIRAYLKLVLDEDDEIVREFVNRRRSISPKNYRDLSQRLLSYLAMDAIEPDNTTDSNKEEEQLQLLQNTVNVMRLKLQDSAFDERERREIQRIVLDDDDDEVFCNFPLPKPIQLKTEPIDDMDLSRSESNDNGEIGNSYIVCGPIPFEMSVSLL